MAAREVSRVGARLSDLQLPPADGPLAACKPVFPFHLLEDLGNLPDNTLAAVLQMYKSYCQACVDVAAAEASMSIAGSYDSSSTPSTKSSSRRRGKRGGVRSSRSSLLSASVGSGKVAASSKMGFQPTAPGFCYLSVVSEPKRGRYASKFGSGVQLAQLAGIPVQDSVGIERLEKLRVSSAGKGAWHCAEVGEFSFAEVMASVACSYRTVSDTVGRLWPADSFCGAHHLDTMGFSLPIVGVDRGEACVADALRKLKAIVKNQPLSVLMVWLAAATLRVHDPFVVATSMVVAVEGRFMPSDGKDERVYQMALATPGLGVARVPPGWRVSHEGAVFGCENTETLFAFRDYCEVRLVPSGNAARVGSPVKVTVLVGDGVTALLSRLVDPKSTDARLLRANSASVVLRHPVVRTGQIKQHLDRVEVSDPLEVWAAMSDVRWECHEGEFGGVSRIRNRGLRVYRTFRSSSEVALMVNSCVVLCSSQASVAFFDGVILQLTAQVEEYCKFQPLGASKVDWSLHEVECADAYCMDNGGPSDSEFSDAI